LLAWILLALVLNTCLVGTAAWYVMRETLPQSETSLISFLFKIIAITLAVGTLSLAAFQNHWQARQLAVKAKQAELEALTARIRPHFLFNTLNAGASLIHGRPEEAERLLLNLADLFRAALSGQQEIRLEDELALARGYVEIELLRFTDRLNIHWDLPSPLPDILVPALSIQPLIENAIKHGMEPSSVRVNVEVIVKLESRHVSITVLNDMPKNKPTIVSGHQVGLLSSRERIRALSHGRAELNTRIENDRFIAVISLPTEDLN
jgi:two-component system sensor histidine kinase AlgZ